MQALFLLTTFPLFWSSEAFVIPAGAAHSSALFSSLSLPPDDSSDPTRHASEYKNWGVDKDHDEEYWFNDKIHTLGNTGVWGAVHAAMAPLATKMIDNVAYDGVDVRESIAIELAQSIESSKARVVDLCCGVGMSTRALQQAFPDAEAVIGVDTSPEMISMAEFLSDQQCRVKPVTDFFNEHFHTINTSIKAKGTSMKRAYVKARQAIAKYRCENAENTALPDKSFDLVTVMYAFHEAPQAGRDKILAEAARLLHKGGVLALVDITPDYEPSSHMLAGEPYVLEYQKNIHRQLSMVKGFTKATFRNLVPGHVGVWLLHRA